MEQTQIHLRFRLIGAVALVIGGIAWMSGGFEATSYFYGWVFWACMTFGFLGVSLLPHMAQRSEKRRVGKGCRSRGSPDH